MIDIEELTLRCYPSGNPIDFAERYGRLWDWVLTHKDCKPTKKSMDQLYWTYPMTIARFLMDMGKVYRCDIIDLLRSFQIPVKLPYFESSLGLYTYAALRAKAREDTIGPVYRDEALVRVRSYADESNFERLVFDSGEDCLDDVLNRYKECRYGICLALNWAKAKENLSIYELLIRHRKYPICNIEDLRVLLAEVAIRYTIRKFRDEIRECREEFIREVQPLVVFAKQLTGKYEIRWPLQMTDQEKLQLYHDHKEVIWSMVFDGRLNLHYDTFDDKARIALLEQAIEYMFKIRLLNEE